MLARIINRIAGHISPAPQELALQGEKGGVAERLAKEALRFVDRAPLSPRDSNPSLQNLKEIIRVHGMGYGYHYVMSYKLWERCASLPIIRVFDHLYVLHFIRCLLETDVTSTPTFLQTIHNTKATQRIYILEDLLKTYILKEKFSEVDLECLLDTIENDVSLLDCLRELESSRLFATLKVSLGSILLKERTRSRISLLNNLLREELYNARNLGPLYESLPEHASQITELLSIHEVIDGNLFGDRGIVETSMTATQAVIATCTATPAKIRECSSQQLLGLLERCKQSDRFRELATRLYNDCPDIRVGDNGRQFRETISFSTAPRLLDNLDLPNSDPMPTFIALVGHGMSAVYQAFITNEEVIPSPVTVAPPEELGIFQWGARDIFYQVPNVTDEDSVPHIVGKCSVCIDEQSEMAFTCGHVCFCYTCSPNVDKCPLCRRQGQKIKLFFS